jgi:hypothetical protein
MPLGFAETPPSSRFAGDELVSASCVTIEWVPLTCGVPSSVHHSLTDLNLAYSVLFL